jgi:uncharacterized membrane protein YbhN (UPF0104 family)
LEPNLGSKRHLQKWRLHLKKKKSVYTLSLYTVLAMVAAITLFIVLFKPQNAFHLLWEVNIWMIVTAFFLCLLSSFIFRSIIWKVYFYHINKNINFFAIFSVISASILSSLFIPARAGEPVTAYLFHKLSKEPIGSLLSFALFERILILAWAIIFFISSILFESKILNLFNKISFSGLHDGGVMAIIVIAVVVIFLILLVIKKISSTFIGDMVEGVLKITKNTKLVITTASLSFMILCMGIIFNLTVIWSFPQQIILFEPYSIVIGAFISCGALVLSVLAILPSGIGVAEFGFAGIMVLAGFSPEAASMIVLLNIMTVYMVTLSSFFCVQARELYNRYDGN